jgi:hypothetical protein
MAAIIVCGPMVRRVTESSAAVFLALSAPATVTLIVARTTDPAGVHRAAAATLQFGTSPHLVVVEVSASLRPGEQHDEHLVAALGDRRQQVLIFELRHCLGWGRGTIFEWAQWAVERSE